MRATHLEVCGFRSYGPVAQRIDLSAPLAVVHADNSQGKTSLAEAIEFLFTGETSRRLLAGGSPSEFQDALRNAHLGVGDSVYVELGLVGKDGCLRVLRRHLVSDYQGASDCVSALTLDGAKIQDVSEAGLALSNPPLAAPVLLEHTLRYAISAKPGERSDYFRAVLEIADIDKVRSEVAALITEREAIPRHRTLAALDTLTGTPAFAEALRHILGKSPTLSAVEKYLRAVCHEATPPNEAGEVSTESLSEAVARVRKVFLERQATLLPIVDLKSSPPLLPRPASPVSTNEDPDPEPPNLADGLKRDSSDYRKKVLAVDFKTASVIPLLSAALRIDAVTNIDSTHPADCPLCETPAALTIARIAAIREEIIAQDDLSSAASQLQGALSELIRLVADAAKSVHDSVPQCSMWSEERRDAHTTTTVKLGAQAGDLPGVLGDADALQASSAATHEAYQRADRELNNLLLRTTDLRAIGDDELEAATDALRQLEDSLSDHAALHDQASAKVNSLVEVIQPQLDAGSDTTGWPQLIELGSDARAVWAIIDANSRFVAATTRLKKAQREIIAAGQTALDRRLLQMGGEVGKWWGLMRPEELTAFDRIARRGSGSKFLDVTAALAPEAAAPGIVRNALAVFSNSQLNALGLAAFLARCSLLGVPLVVLDDPVPGSDREHRSTFAHNVVAALLAEGRQVIIATHDSELARHLHTSHQHLGVDEFEANLVDPRVGTQLVRTGDDFERLMLDASAQMHSPMVNSRRSAGNSLRIATERLAKHVVVAGRRRAGDASASIADYDNKNLKDLRPLAISHAVKDNEPGQWSMLARTLNNADHDTDPPMPMDLKVCHDALRQLKRQHVAHDPKLTHA